jgi:hypothetical protein
MSYTRDQIERLVRVNIRDLNPHKQAFSQREIAQTIESQAIEIIEELPLELTRTVGAMTLASGDYRKAFLPAVDVSSIAAVILDSVNQPLVKTPFEMMQSLRIGQQPAKATWPWRYAIEETEAQVLYLWVWPTYFGAGDTLTTIIASSGTTLPLGTTAVPLAIAGSRCLALRCSIECYMRMGQQERDERRLGPELIDPGNPRSWVSQADKLFQQESDRLFMMDAPNEVSQMGRP